MRPKSRRLKVAIIESDKTQRGIAAGTGISESRLSTLANGWAEPRDDERQAIADALGRPADELFTSETP